MKRGLIARRLEAALEKSRRDDPDGPLASYSWMWRALVRSSPSRVGVVFRFASLVIMDAALLLGWSIVRPVRIFFRSPSRRLAAAVAGATTAMVLMFGPPLRSPSPPWNGVPTLSVEANGLIRFEGQVVSDRDALSIVRDYDVEEASIFVDPGATAKRVIDVTNLLIDAGIVFTTVEVGEAS